MAVAAQNLPLSTAQKTDPVIRIDELQAHYGTRQILRNIDAKQADVSRCRTLQTDQMAQQGRFARNLYFSAPG